MKRLFVIVAVMFLLMAGMAPRALAAQQNLEVLSHQFYPMRDIVFVDFYNPSFNPVDNISVNMIIREGTGRNRIIAIGQAFLPENLVLAPGEHVSVKVPIRARVVRDIPLLADFQFQVAGRQLAADALPPDVVVAGSPNGVTLEFNRDPNGVPIVVGFIQLNPEKLGKDTQAQVSAAVLTFLDADRDVVWTEVLPVNARLEQNDMAMIWAKYEHMTNSLVPNIDSVEVKLLVTGNSGR